MEIARRYETSLPTEGYTVEEGADETSFLLLKEYADADFRICFTVEAPIADTYIMLPACIYDGNRFERVERAYPPMFTEEEMGLEVPVRMTNVPALEASGDSCVDVTTGDLATPAVCLWNKAGKEALFLFTEQGSQGRNYGVTLEQRGDRLDIIISAPARRRRVYGAGVIPDEKRPFPVKAGARIRIAHRTILNPCASIPLMYRQFMKYQLAIYHGEVVDSFPFSESWRLSEEKRNRDHFLEEEGYYTGCAYRSPAFNKFGDWQAGWTGNGMDTLVLIREGSPQSRKNSVRTLEFAAKYQSEAGFYYGIVHEGKIYHDCFGHYEGKYNLLLVRKQADMAYFVYKQIQAMEELGMEVPETVRRSAQKAADALVRLWETYGQLGQFINAETGEIVVGGSASGAIAPAALCAAAQVTGNQGYLKTAREIGEYYYETATAKGITNGGPGEILQAPDSESAVALLESYTALYDALGSLEWLERAEDAAAQVSSWVVPYNYEFPEDSVLGRLGVGSVGSVWANVQNKHSAPGFCTLSAAGFLKLWRATGKKEYLEIMRRVARFIPQVIARDGYGLLTTAGVPMEAGCLCERVNLSDWEGLEGVGGNIFGPCSWPEVSMMLNWLEVPGVYVAPDQGILCCSDHIEAYLEGQALVLTNRTEYDACVKVMAESGEDRKKPLGLSWQDKMRRVNVKSGATVTFSLA